MIERSARIEPTAYQWKYVNDLVYLDGINGSYVLNSIGSKIWKMLDGFTTLDAIIKQVMIEEGETDEHEVETVVTEFLEMLAEHSFVAINSSDEEEDW